MKGKYIVLTGCILCLLAGCGKERVSDYELGTEDLLGKNYESAIANFETAIADGGKNEAEAWRGEGIAYYKLGQYEEARQALEQAKSIAGEKDEALLADILSYLAAVCFHQEDYEGSIQTCNELLELRKNQDGYFLRGRSYLYLNDYDNASSDFDKAVADSEDYNDYLNVYQVYTECELKADGEEYLERALNIEGRDEEDHYNRGRLYYYLEEYDQAKEELTSSYNDGYKQAAIYLGKVYAELGDTTNARVMYQECLEDEELKAKAYNGIAYCDILDGDYDTALTNIQAGLDTGDEEEKQGLLFNEIIAYEKKTDYASAKEKMTAYLALYPTDKAAVKENYFLETR